MLVKKKVVAFDLEADGLLDELTKMHCAVINDGTNIEVFTDVVTLGEYLKKYPNIVLACHNCFNFDKRALKKLGLDVKNQWIDTLGISWYLDINRKRHGLGDYGEEFGVPKPKIEDWKNLPVEEYIHRNKKDTKIQKRLWRDQWDELLEIYGSPDAAWKCIEYINFKMKLLALKSGTKWKLDVPLAQRLWDQFESDIVSKRAELEKFMPKIPKKGKRKPPAKPYKKDGTLSATGQKWKDLTEEHDLPFSHNEEIEVITDWVEPNAGSHKQVKDWLFSLGWEPETFDYKKDDKPESVYREEVARYKEENGGKFSKAKYPKRYTIRAIPQINIDGGDVCPSIHKLMEKHPEVENLAGLGVLSHRKSIVKGWVENHKDGYLEARAQGFTNTLRLRHKELVNLPSDRKPYGAELRSCLTCEEGEVLLGSDLSSLEDRLKHHFQWEIDPEYVKSQMTDGFDPHLLMCESAGLLSKDECNKYKQLGKLDADTISNEDKEWKASVGKVRHMGKGANYACQYGSGVDTIVRQVGIEEEVAKKLHKAYWDINWSIEEIAKGCVVKKISNGKKWLFNPISGIWYFLKADKDRFSTLIQGSGSYIFDMWSKEVITICYKRYKRLPNFVADFHDELILRLKDTDSARQAMEDVVVCAIDNVNKNLQLNRDMAADVSFDRLYSGIH